MSAASTAVVYLSICCRMASAAALASLSLVRDDPHDAVNANATHRLNARALTAIALFGFFTVDCPGDCKLIREHAKTVSPERFLKRHANNTSFRQFRKQAF